MSTDIRPCRGCGVPIKFVANDKGKIVPLDTRAPVYEVQVDFAGKVTAVPIPNAHVSHFSTCPKANDFSASKKERERR